MGFDFIVLIILIILLLAAALATVLLRDLLASAILLALTSTVVALILFVLGMRLAAVMELAVCAGLVTAVFASAISLLKPERADRKNRAAENRAWILRHLPLPVILLVLGALVLIFVPQIGIDLIGETSTDPTVQMVLWDARLMDILGLVLLILAGVLGVAVLIGHREEK